MLISFGLFFFWHELHEAALWVQCLFVLVAEGLPGFPKKILPLKKKSIKILLGMPELRQGNQHKKHDRKKQQKRGERKAAKRPCKHRNMNFIRTKMPSGYQYIS